MRRLYSYGRFNKGAQRENSRGEIVAAAATRTSPAAEIQMLNIYCETAVETQ